MVKSLNSLSDEALLKLRLCDLNLKIKGSWIEPMIKQLNDELAQKKIIFRPYFWISSEWFVPDGVAGVALPFYLFHPNLMRLEQSMVYEVEGGTEHWCMQILRHEVGHAIDNAFQLRRNKRRPAIFGRASMPYPVTYVPKPYSKKYVIHLDSWYAQSHPAEDWAETFAVWLDPKSNWRQYYKGWPAIDKLKLVDELMKDKARLRPKKCERSRPFHISELRRTLKRHYADKQRRYGLKGERFFDHDLELVFGARPKNPPVISAARFVTQERKLVRQKVAKWTGHYQYCINEMIDDVVASCKEKKLYLKQPQKQTRMDLIAMLVAQSAHYLASGAHKIPM